MRAEGMVFDVQRFSLQNGPGIRTTVFFQGCALRCWWCSNPEGQRPEPERMYKPRLCAHCGACTHACPSHLPPTGGFPASGCARCLCCVRACPTGALSLCGRLVSAQELLAIALRDLAYYRRSGGGLTLSGGECLLQPNLALPLLRMAAEQGLHTAVDTCLFAPGEAVKESMRCTQLYLVDLKHMETGKHREGTGHGNETILENLCALFAARKGVWIRVPVIPGFNDTEKNFAAMASFLRGETAVQRVELLPGHNIGAEKYAFIGQNARLVPRASKEHLNTLAAILVRAGLPVRIRKV